MIVCEVYTRLRAIRSNTQRKTLSESPATLEKLQILLMHKSSWMQKESITKTRPLVLFTSMEARIHKNWMTIKWPIKLASRLILILKLPLA
uniref:Uncharacterized protein n=1 Tax=Phakopsora pachyrhizi TaxID=170000 RepID=A0A0S1MKJ1_PHAPC